MNETVVVILVAAIVLAGIAILAFQYLRTRRLRERFGPEYARAVREAGDRKSAESKLERLEKRVERLRIRAIEPADRERFLGSWRSVQTTFVDAIELYSTTWSSTQSKRKRFVPADQREKYNRRKYSS
jgi:hypothetical protein